LIADLNAPNRRNGVLIGFSTFIVKGESCPFTLNYSFTRDSDLEEFMSPRLKVIAAYVFDETPWFLWYEVNSLFRALSFYFTG
jgi:hypothetical protein